MISSFLRLCLRGRYLRCTIVVIIKCGCILLNAIYNVKEEDLHTTQNLYKLLLRSGADPTRHHDPHWSYGPHGHTGQLIKLRSRDVISSHVT
jgi:hypothetical protein